MPPHFVPVAAAFLCLQSALPAAPSAAILRNNAPGSNDLKLVWDTQPGLFYEVERSPDLAEDSWSIIEGSGAAADGILAELPLPTTASAPSGFFRVITSDRTGPSLEDSFPEDGFFGVRRFGELAFQVADPSGIDPSGTSLEISNLGTITLGDPELVVVDGIVSFNAGGTYPLGNYGDTVTATLHVADLNGNTTSKSITFELEQEPVINPNAFVFSDADASSWIESVTGDSIIVGYSGSPPPIMIDSLLCNMDPASEGDIFYRRATAVTDDTGSSRLIVTTIDVPAAEFIDTGTATLDDSATLVEFGAPGALQRTLSLNKVINLGRYGINREDETIYRNEDLGIDLSVAEAQAEYIQSLWVAMEIKSRNLERMTISLRGTLEAALVPELTLTPSTEFHSPAKELYETGRAWRFVVGGIPIWFDLDFNVLGAAGYSANADVFMTAGARQRVGADLTVNYVRGAAKPFTWSAGLYPDEMEVIPFTFDAAAEVNAYVTLIANLDIKAYNLMGVVFSVDPRLEVSGFATAMSDASPEYEWDFVADADLNIGLSVAGIDNGNLPGLPSVKLFENHWADYSPRPIEIIVQPADQQVSPGSNARIDVSAAGMGQLSYQWYFDGTLLPGATGRELLIENFGPGQEGAYSVLICDESSAVVLSDIAYLTLKSAPKPGDTKARMSLLEYVESRGVNSTMSINDVIITSLGGLDRLPITDLTIFNGDLGDVHLGRLDEIHTLVLLDCGVTSFALDSAPALTYLNLGDNSLDFLHLGAVPELHRLWLVRCDLDAFSLTDTPNLRDLNLNANDLTSFSYTASPLQSLRISLNDLASFHLGSYNLLKTLDLSYNELPVLIVPDAPVLEVLSAGVNQIQSFSIGSTPRLVSLYLAVNQLSSFSLGNLPLLKHLDLFTNRISSLNLGSLPELERLQLQTNQLSAFQFTSSGKLVDLRLASNQLTSFSIPPSNVLEHLDLRNNRLPSPGDIGIYQAAFASLKTVDLSENYIDFSEPDAGAVQDLLLLSSADVTLTPQFQPGDNDSFAFAEVLEGTSGDSGGFMADKTSEENEPDHGLQAASIASAWFRWTAPSDGYLVFHANFSNSQTASENTHLVYQGDSLETLTPIGRLLGYDGPTYSYPVGWKVRQGVEYHLVLAENSDANSQYTISYDFVPKSGQDTFAQATLIDDWQEYSPTSGGGNLYFGDIQATGETGEPNHAAAADPLNSIWWKWVAPIDGMFSFSAYGTYDPDSVPLIIAVYQGDGLATLTEVTSDIYGYVEFPMMAGETYYIAIDSLGAGDPQGDINFSYYGE